MGISKEKKRKTNWHKKGSSPSGDLLKNKKEINTME